MDVSAYGDSFHSAQSLRSRLQVLGRVGFKDYLTSLAQEITVSRSAERYVKL